jgi:hypothetical protein
VGASVRARRAGRARRSAGSRPHPLVSLVSRFVFGQAVMAGAIGLAYSRRNVPWLLITLMLAVSLCLLAIAIRSGTHSIWTAAVGFEAVLAVVGLYRFIFFGQYTGGLLLSMITFGVLMHPAVGRAFTAPPGRAAQPAEASFEEVGEQPPAAFGEGTAS